jgi:glycerol-3-phosphate dehydrogenase
MKRNVAELANRNFDLLVLGGGVHGLCIAWDAARRGLTVALIEKGDFGGGTSAGSFKLVHGGLRYLQHLDLRRMRESIGERRWLLQAAPHLVRPLPFLVPCYGHGLRGRAAMKLAMVLNDLISADRNGGLDPALHIPPGRILSRAETLARVPGLPAAGLTGAAVFYDAQMFHSERLTLAFARAAGEAGAVLANYVRATGFLREGDRIAGIKAIEELSGQPIDIRSALTINATGPWTHRILGWLGGSTSSAPSLCLCRGFQVLTRPLVSDCAVAVESAETDPSAVISRGHRQYFITPWRGWSNIGTTDEPFEGDPDDFTVGPADVARFLDQINRAFPAAGLTAADVRYWTGGLRPADEQPAGAGGPAAARRHLLIDHEARNKMPGLITVAGVKYTTARRVAEVAVDYCLRKLGRRAGPCTTRTAQLPGGQLGNIETFRAAELERPLYHRDTTERLVRLHGAGLPALRALGQADPSAARPLAESTDTLAAEVLLAVRDEMAVRLSDVVLRRTDLASFGRPDARALAACADLMKRELGWSSHRTDEERRATDEALRVRHP